jgi:hypothetical protein
MPEYKTVNKPNLEKSIMSLSIYVFICNEYIIVNSTYHLTFDMGDVNLSNITFSANSYRILLQLQIVIVKYRLYAFIHYNEIILQKLKKCTFKNSRWVYSQFGLISSLWFIFDMYDKNFVFKPMRGHYQRDKYEYLYNSNKNDKI